MFEGPIPQPAVTTTRQSFEALGLADEILETVREVGFEHPTPVQSGVIPVALEGRDVIGLAETGSGKTAAFCLPLAQHLIHGRGVRGLILCPTREIALQTKSFLDVFGRNHDLDTVCVIGGVKIGPQIQGLKAQPDLVVATPGRLLDHMERHTVRLDRIEKLVLDEADHMLDLGFLPQIVDILQDVPRERQTLMFSATMPPEIERLTRHFMSDPELVDLRPAGRTAAGITHRLYLVEEDDKKPCLLALVKAEDSSTLVFLRRKVDADWAHRQLELEGHAVARIHSDRSQSQRLKALEGFRQGHHRILVATDIAARGLDIPRIEHIINFDMPQTVEDYVHRAGRTARGAREGVVSSIGTWQDKAMVRAIEKAIGEPIPRCVASGVEPYEELESARKARRSARRRRFL